MVTRLTVVVALTLALVASGSAAASRQNSSGVLGAAKSKSSGTLVKLRKTKFGKVLVTSTGRTLYMYTPDAKNKSNCYTSCASLWPPLVSKGKPAAGSGVKAKLLGVTKRTDGKHQVTYNGHPLYRFSGDAKAGQVKGEGYGSIWYVLSAAGKAVKHASGGGTTTGGGYGGY